MASVSESCPNAVHGTSSASQDKVGQFPMFFQGLEIILKDPDKSYQDKVCALLSAWERLASYSNQSSISDGVSKITDRLYRDTLRLVLRCEWTHLPQANKTHLTVTLQRTAVSLSNTSASELCQHVIRLIKSPWDNSSLSKIFEDSDINDEEVLDFCVAENPVLLSARLDILCESKCEDLALKLVKVCRKCSSAKDTRFSAMCSAAQLEHWLDLHVALLYRAMKMKEELLPLIEQLTFDEGYQLVKRLIDRGKAFNDPSGTVSRSRVWRPSLTIAVWLSHCFITNALLICPPPLCLKALVIQFVNIQKLLDKLNQDVMNMLRDLVDRVSRITSAHMYMLASTLSAEFGEEFKPLCIELYVRALAVDINYHEKLISKRAEINRTSSGTDEASVQKRDAVELEVKQAETGLAEAVSSLADLVDANVKVCKECALTAFSLEPTTARLNKLVKLASLTTEQSKGDISLAHTTADLNALPTSDYHQSTMEYSRNAVVGEPPPGSGGGPGGGSSPCVSQERRGSDCSTPEFTSVKETLEDVDSGVDLPDVPNGSCDIGSPTTQTSDEEVTPYSDTAAASLGVSAAVIKDLAVVVHGVRWDVLNWKMGWKKLEPLCQQYLANPEMRSVTEELRFLKPDFSQFKDVPRPERDEFWGIEKGYENCLEISEEEAVESPKPRASSKSKKSAKRRPASGSSSPQPDELAERKKVLKKKLMRRESSLSFKTSSDSDSPRLLDPNETAEFGKRTQRSKTKKTSPLIKTLRAMRPDFSSGTQWTDCTVPTNRLSLDGADLAGRSTPDSCSNNVQRQLSFCLSSSSPLSSTSLPSTVEDHFAPMLSTLDMNPKVVLKRTPVKSPDSTPVKQIIEKGTKPFRTSPNLLQSYVLLDKLDQKNHINLERTMTNLKGLDNLDVRPQTTAVHMVQLPNPPANAHVATANGLSVSVAGTGSATTITNNGSANPDIRQEQQQQQEEANKTTGGSAVAPAPNGDEPPVFSSTTSVEITSALSGTSLPEPVTLLSTPSVSIFQVAHRPVGNTGAVLQPVAAVTGFNPPNPRLKNPVVGAATRLTKGTRGASTAMTPVPVRPAVEPLPSITLSQLLAQSPSTEDTVPVSTGTALNGPAPPVLTNKASRGGKRRGAAPNNSEVPSNSDCIQLSASVSSSSPSPADNSSPCHVPLVKYVDLNMVSSPSRPRPGSTVGMRRLSQGSNSNSPDPHRSATKNHRGAQNPASPAINSPQSPALQAPPSPLSFRKQQQQQAHHIFRGQDNKALSGDRLASPSHPSQCSSPFSRPSSRSQDTSPSPSDLLSGSMFPPNFMPFSSDGGSNSNHPGASPSPSSSTPTSGRLPSFSGSSQASAASFPSALPKFGQAFSRKSHFEVIPSLGSLSSPPSNVVTSSAALPTLNTIPDPHLQAGRVASNSLRGNGFGGERRFPAEQNMPNDEVEGLGSKLSSLLESALNGQITRSPTRGLTSNPPIVSNPDLLLSDSAHSISPLVGGMDSQSGSEAAGSGTTAFTEQLREFESIFAQVRGENPWPDQPDDTSFMGVGAVEFLPPPSTFSESMDVSEASLASPNSAEGHASSQAEEPVVTNESPSGTQLHELLSAASNARQALKNEEKESENSIQSPLAQVKLTSVKEEVIDEVTTESRSEPETQSLPSDHAFPSPPPVAPPTPKSNPTRLVVLPTVLTGPIVVQSAETVQQNTANVNSVAQTTVIKTEPTKNNRAKTPAKSTPVVSPGASAANSPSKVTTPTSSSSSSSASSKAPPKAHDDEHTVLRVHAILEEYKEQLRNSPDLQNKPAPRRRSNPLPSPSTSAPKRRKSVQSKVKLLSQHVRPPDGVVDGASNATGSAESTPSASNEPQTSNSDNASPCSDSNKAESNNQSAIPANSGVQEKQDGTVAVQMIPAGIQLSIPAGAVVTNRPAASTANDGTSASSASVGTATVTVSTTQGTQITSLTGVPTVPLSTVLSQHQLLVSTGAAGVQRLQLVPLNFSPARAGSSPRGTYIQVRQVTMSGQPGVISFPARFTTPIRYVSTTQQPNQTGSQDQQQQQQIVVTSLPKVATSTAGETHLLLQEIPTSQATSTVVKPITVSTAPSQPPSVVSLSAAGVPGRSEETETLPGTTNTQAIDPATTTTTTSSVLRLLPTVTKVSLPAAPTRIEEPALSPATLSIEPSTPTPPPLTLASAAIDTPLDSSSIAETEATNWSHHSSPNEQTTAIDSAVTPVTDDKLLNDVETGVSDFLPCADFMGPGVSPSPCFSLSDSPLGSKESSPVTSPATFQASSTEDESNSHAITGDDAMLSSAGSNKSNKAKILKRNNKPMMVMVRKDHGGMEYRRMSDGEGGTGVIRNETQSLSKRLAAKRAAAVATTEANTSAGSSPAHPASRSASPLPSSPVPSISADSHPTKNDVKPKGITLMIKKNADNLLTVQKTASKQKQVDMTAVELPPRSNDSTVQIKEEVAKEDPLDVDGAAVGEGSTEADGVLSRRLRRCSRFKKEPVEEPMDHDSQSCHLGSETKMLRRSSVRTNVKKNCPCCVSGTNEKRKRSKSEPVETGSSDLPALAKRGSIASQSFTEDTVTSGSPLTTRLAAANAAAKNDSTPTNRSKAAKKSHRKR